MVDPIYAGNGGSFKQKTPKMRDCRAIAT